MVYFALAFFRGGQNATKMFFFFSLHRCNIVLQITMLVTMTIIIANRFICFSFCCNSWFAVIQKASFYMIFFPFFLICPRKNAHFPRPGTGGKPVESYHGQPTFVSSTKKIKQLKSLLIHNLLFFAGANFRFHLKRLREISTYYFLL